MVNPNQVAHDLRRIATKLDASNNPSVSRVRQDLKRVLFTVTRPERVRQIASDILRLAQDDAEVNKIMHKVNEDADAEHMDVSLWDTDEGKDVDQAYEFAKKRGDDPKKLEFALKSTKHDIDRFIDELKRDPSSPKKEKDDDEDVTTSAPTRHELRRGPAKKSPPPLPKKK